MLNKDNCTIKFLFTAVVILSLLFALGCIPKPTANIPFGSLYKGMVKIVGKSKTFRQGWNDSLASSDEKPGMLTTFTYDFWMDTTEITQKEFFDITGRHPVPDSSAYGIGDHYPVYFVSWFDAVLFCNARSKIERLDTVYVYSGKKSLSNGNVYDLTGLYNNFACNGYRLPTESEWEYAARGASSLLPFASSADSSMADADAWYARNSSGTTHPVATKAPNSSGLYDMTGNVFEWTNDWKGLYDSVPIVNPLGAPQPGKEFEKVVKGGSFNYDMAYLRPSHRSSTYPTIPSSTNEYVGFRCAATAIPQGQYMGAVTRNFTPNPVLIRTGGTELRSFLNALKAKLVFVNVSNNYRTLCFVDFSINFPSVKQFPDDTDVYAPALSPDGRYAAYCSRDVGLSGPSKITVRPVDSAVSPRSIVASDSAYIPRWWIDPMNGDTCIIFTNSAMANSSPLWQSTKTFKQKIKGGVPFNFPVELPTGGGYHDGISRDGRFSVTGYTRLMARDLSAGQEQQLFQPTHNGKDADGSTQVCNASISPETGSALRCMFLDFGYPKTSSVTNCSYGVHQFLFVATLQDSITRCFNVPTNEKTWDYPAWSNTAGYAVSSARGPSDQAHAIYLINLEKGLYLPVIEGTELQQSSVWVGDIIPNPSGFPLDSIGRYETPLSSGYQAQLSGKLLIFWQRCDSLEAAIIGSSQAANGFDPRCISGMKCFNFATAGGDLLGQKNMLLKYLLPHCPRLKVVCSSLDIGWLGNVDGDFSWKKGIGQSFGYAYDSTHGFWKNGVTDDFKAVMRAIPAPIYWDTLLLLGFALSTCSGWGDSTPQCVLPQAWTVHDDAATQNIKSIEMMADSLRHKNVHWIMIDFPVSPHYKNTAYYSLWGPQWQTALDIQQKLLELEKSNPYFHFYNANMNGNHDYTEAEAQDENHLCSIGAQKLGNRVDSLIHTIIH
jgi:uncharacterized protein (TIGR02171 family)